MKIHFFTKREATAGSSRQRAFLVVDWLNKKGMPADIHSPSASTISETPWPAKGALIWKHFKALGEIKKGDVVYLQRPLGNKYLVVMLVLYKWLTRRTMYFDMDDSVFVYMPHKLRFFTKLCDEIVVGSHYLYDWAKRYNPNVHLIPTSLDVGRYQLFTRDYSKPNDVFTIGWIGGANYHLENLKLLVPVFEELIRRGVRFKFILVGASKNPQAYQMFGDIKGLNAELIDALDWTDPQAVPKMIQTFDVGLMPLVDTPTARGKCAFKAIEYMACGVVPVVSPVGENPTLVKDGINGFLAADASEWANKIERVMKKNDEALALGRVAQQTIKENYSFDSNVDKLIQLFTAGSPTPHSKT